MSTLFGKKKKKTNVAAVTTITAAAARKRQRSEEEEEDQNATNGDHSDAIITPSASHTLPLLEQQQQQQNDPYYTTMNSVATGPKKSVTSFADLGLVEPLVNTCYQLGYSKPTAVQQVIIPFLIQNRHVNVMAIAATGTGKTAAYTLPILHHLSYDPYGIYAVVITPTRELGQQIHQQIVALGASYNICSVLVVGGLDTVQQSVTIDQKKPHVIVATPGRFATLLRNPQPPPLQHIRYLVLDEADRLLAGTTTTTSGTTSHSNCGFERDIAEILLHCRTTTTTTTSLMTPFLQQEEQQQHFRRKQREPCQVLLFSATITASLQTLEDLAGFSNSTATSTTGGNTNDHQQRLPLRKFVIRQENDKSSNRSKALGGTSGTSVEAAAKCNDVDDDDDDDDSANKETDLVTTVGVKIPNGLQQEYIFMPDRVRDAYLLATVRTLLAHGGRLTDVNDNNKANKHNSKRGGSAKKHKKQNQKAAAEKIAMSAVQSSVNDDDDDVESFKAKSAIIFVSTCERAALVSGILDHVGVPNVALHSLLSQHRRLAALGKFQSEHVRVMVATDVAARGLDVPHTDLVINAELPRNPINYVHRVGRTARAGRRGRAISLVSEADIRLVHAAEAASGRPLLKCTDVTDAIAVTMLGPAAKAARLTKLQLADIGFDTLVQKMKERKVRDRKDRQLRAQRAMQLAKRSSEKTK